MTATFDQKTNLASMLTTIKYLHRVLNGKETHQKEFESFVPSPLLETMTVVTEQIFLIARIPIEGETVLYTNGRIGVFNRNQIFAAINAYIVDDIPQWDAMTMLLECNDERLYYEYFGTKVEAWFPQ